MPIIRPPNQSPPLEDTELLWNFWKDFADFNEAAKDSRTNQLAVLRNALHGNAKSYIYLGLDMSIDHAWAKLKDA